MGRVPETPKLLTRVPKTPKIEIRFFKLLTGEHLPLDGKQQ